MANGRVEVQIRASDDPQIERTTVDRNEEFWFEDGTIVLLVAKEAGEGDTAFRIYKGLLARHSPVFSDLFAAVPQPEAEEQIDGCPTVRISDPPEDVVRTLRLVLGARQAK